MLDPAENVKLSYYLGMRLDDLNLGNAATFIDSNAAVEAQVKATLTKLDAIETRIADVVDNGDMMKVDEVTFNPAQSLFTLRSEGRRLVKTLSIITGISVWRDVFNPAIEPSSEALSGFPFNRHQGYR